MLREHETVGSNPTALTSRRTSRLTCDGAIVASRLLFTLNSPHSTLNSLRHGTQTEKRRSSGLRDRLWVRLPPVSLTTSRVGWTSASPGGCNPPASGCWRFDSVPTHRPVRRLQVSARAPRTGRAHGTHGRDPRGPFVQRFRIPAPHAGDAGSNPARATSTELRAGRAGAPSALIRPDSRFDPGTCKWLRVECGELRVQTGEIAPQVRQPGGCNPRAFCDPCAAHPSRVRPRYRSRAANASGAAHDRSVRSGRPAPGGIRVRRRGSPLRARCDAPLPHRPCRAGRCRASRSRLRRPRRGSPARRAGSPR